MPRPLPNAFPRRVEVLVGWTLAASVHPVAAWRSTFRLFRVLALVGYFAAGYIAVLVALVLRDWNSQ